MKLTSISLTICFVLGVLTSAQTHSGIAGPRWKLTEVNGVAVTNSRAFLQFDAKKYSGSSSCNFIGGNYKIGGRHIFFSQGFITRRNCLDEETQKIETEFMKAFSEVTDFAIEGDELRLYSVDHVVLVFKG